MLHRVGLSAEQYNTYIIFKHIVMLIGVRDVFGTELEINCVPSSRGFMTMKTHPPTTLSAFNA